MRRFYASKIEAVQFFTNTEAWNLFRLAAFGEAFGWTLLIGSLVFKHYVTPGNNIPIDIAGQIHGTIFLIYLAAVVVLHPSLHWSPKRTLIAGLVSIPPYGTLVFEQWVAHKRRVEALQSYRQLVVRALIVSKGSLFVVQPKDSGFWYPPGGVAEAHETPEQALRRILIEQTGVEPDIGSLLYVWQHHGTNTQQLEFFFSVTNVRDYLKVNLAMAKTDNKVLDETSFIQASHSSELRPEFLQTIQLPKPTHRDKVTFL